MNRHNQYSSFSLLFFTWLICCLAFQIKAAYGESPTIQMLNTGWQLARVPDVSQTGDEISRATFDSSTWLKAVVPGTALYSYQTDGVIPNPYYGTNMARLEQSGYYNTFYWYRDAFYVPSGDSGQKIWLNFDGINWKADVWVNGTYLGQIKGPFTRAKFDATSVITPGATNVIAVQLYWCNATVYDSPTFIAVDSWDFMPAIAGRNVGLYKNVYLSTSGSVNIVDPFIKTTLPLPNTSPANLSLQVDLTNSSATAVSGTLRGNISPDGITFQTNVTVGASSITSLTLTPNTTPQLSITNPALWWPNGYGPQNLHNLQLQFESDGSTSDVQNVSFGIRQYTYNTNGTELQISCNGVRIFCKGGNWGMPDAMLKYTPEQLDMAVRLHKEMNFDMIRCWHGTSDLKAFYDACDKYGIMVWDEFWLNGSNFGLGPNDPAMFIANAEDKFKRLRNRACIAVWCGENEAVPPANLMLPQICSNLDNTRIYIDASNQKPVHGGGPYAVQDINWYFNNAHGFTTEIGMPSIPQVESIKEMMPSDSWWPMGDANWQFHDWDTDIGNKGLPQYTNAVYSRYGPATGIADFCEKAQLLNLQSYKAIFEAWNAKLWNDCSGVLLWMSQPAWPSTIWQTYDWYFGLGGAYFGCKKACEPIHIQWGSNDNSIKAVNTTTQSLSNLSAEVQVYNLDGTVQFETNITGINLPSDSVVSCMTLFGGANNLALNRPAFASSIDNASDAIANAVDGNMSTRWSSAYHDPQWFYVDLGSTQTFDTVFISWEAAYANSFQIQVSNDATNWTTVWSTNGMTLSANGGDSTSEFAPVSARYVRMYGTKRATIWGYSMYEFEVYKHTSNWVDHLSDVHFIKLRLKSSDGNLLSDNFYWRGKTYEDYTALNSLPPVSPVCSASCQMSNGIPIVEVQLTNDSSGIAFAAQLKLINQTTGERVLPAIYSDNYFSLVPGESKTVMIELPNNNASAGPLELKLQGWNIPSQSVLEFSVSSAIPRISDPTVLPSNEVDRNADVSLICSHWSGNGSYSFQWQFSRDGVQYQNVAGGNSNSLALNQVTTNNTGFYRLLFTADGQSVTSSVASLTVSSGLIATPRISVKFAADKGYGYDAISNGWPVGALGSLNWYNLYGSNGGAQGTSRIPFYTARGVTNSSEAVMIYNYSGEGNYNNEQAVLPGNMALMDSFITMNDNGWYLSVTNLDAPFTNGYNVYLYNYRNASGLGGHYGIKYYSGQTTNTPLLGMRQWNLYTTTTNNDGHFTADLTPLNTGAEGETHGANYLVFSNLSGGAFDLVMSNGFYPSVSAMEIVAHPAATMSVLTSSSTDTASGSSVALTAVVSPSPPDNEPVVFLDGSSELAASSLHDGVANYTSAGLSVGNHLFKAIYGGDGSYLGSTSDVVKVAITGTAIGPPIALPAANVYSGANVMLVCSNFYGANPFFFQWQHSADGVDYANIIGSTTNALLLPDVTTNASGSYRVIFTANSLNVTSAVVFLVVNPLPSVQLKKLADSFVLSWADGILQEATNVTGPWVTTDTISPHTNKPTLPEMYYRLSIQ